nr:MAG TPA: hypothetical protein [Caudoviricetes sp.]
MPQCQIWSLLYKFSPSFFLKFCCQRTPPPCYNGNMVSFAI